MPTTKEIVNKHMTRLMIHGGYQVTQEDKQHFQLSQKNNSITEVAMDSMKECGLYLHRIYYNDITKKVIAAFGTYEL